jgi:transposase
VSSWRWIKDLKQEVDGVRLTTDERLEFVRLRREVKELRMEKEILKRRVPSLRKK